MTSHCNGLELANQQDMTCPDNPKMACDTVNQIQWSKYKNNQIAKNVLALK
jgi:hypothetical protein